MKKCTAAALTLTAAGAATVAAAGLCWRIAFKKGPAADFTTREHGPDSPFTLHKEQLDRGLAYVDALPWERVYITSPDGLRLSARYCPAEHERSLAILAHGYRSTGRSDFCCAVEPFLTAGRSLLLLDQRCAGESEGESITFGVKERYDLLAWADYAAKRFPGLPIVLQGISMGAATALMCADFPLPESVAGIIADCGYTTPRDIICGVAREKHLPTSLLWPLTRLGARLFGGFDPDGASALASVRASRVPILFIHGEADDYVPCQMSRRCAGECSAPSRLFTVPGAGHGFAYLTDPDGVQQAIDDFLAQCCGIQ
jgi:pimeloyl-ACP methyl ester carboxylesterase